MINCEIFLTDPWRMNQLVSNAKNKGFHELVAALETQRDRHARQPDKLRAYNQALAAVELPSFEQVWATYRSRLL